MYNRILNRPMFKLGGKTNDAQGTGITSGLDTPRSNYLGGGRTIGGGAFTGTPMGDRTGFQNIYESIDVSVPESTRKRAFWSGIGQGFGSNPRTLGEALNTAVGARDQILGPAEALAAQRKFELEKGGIEKTYDRETAQIITQLESQTKIDVAQIQADNTATAKRIKLLNQKFLKDDGTIDTSNPEYIMQRDTIINDFSKVESAQKLAQALITANIATTSAEALAMALQIIMGAELALKPGDIIRKPEAQGGRIGYQMGTLNQGVQPVEPIQASLNVDETIKTPGGTMQEDVSVQEQTQSSIGIPYQEFRAKMPPEVDDEIVQLIYYNEDAFADFAQITSQADVYAFNNKWGVSLVLPMDTETT